ncbi:MAG: DNA endonuclease SmrA [Candidatus Methylumidiphilus sp.]
MKHEDQQFFEQEMADVRPLRREAAAPPKRHREKPDPGTFYRRSAAQRELGGNGNFLTSGFVEFVHPQAVLSFKRGGVQNGVFAKLQQGGYRIEATLDLHLLSVEEARSQVFDFIRDCIRYEVRTALINHGKGARNPETPAMIKSYVARWLPQLEEIMAFHSAQGFHGGTGAVYVLLRKSAKAKDRARERLGLTSGKPEAGA